MCLGMASGFKPRYEVKDVVCDYGVYEKGKLLLICNSRANALLIKSILETDLQQHVHQQAVHAHWILIDSEKNKYQCSNCIRLGKEDWWKLNTGTPADNKMAFCPHCGAIMDEEKMCNE